MNYRIQGVKINDKHIEVIVRQMMQKVAHSITSLLRLNNIPTDIDLVGRNLKKQMDIANNHCIVVGSLTSGSEIMNLTRAFLN